MGRRSCKVVDSADDQTGIATDLLAWFLPSPVRLIGSKGGQTDA